MKTKEDIIRSMCYTMRHDFGVTSNPNNPLSSGVSASERQHIYNNMCQLFDNCIAPYMTFKNENTDLHQNSHSI
jgi:hypothetical protein